MSILTRKELPQLAQWAKYEQISKHRGARKLRAKAKKSQKDRK